LNVDVREVIVAEVAIIMGKDLVGIDSTVRRPKKAWDRKQPRHSL